MSIDRRLLRPLGLLSCLAALPILEASVMVAVAFFREGDALRTALGTLGSLGAACLLLAGVLLFTKRQAGRDVALWGSAVSIVAHLLGALIGLVGGHGLLYGVGFPFAIVLLLRATSSNGLLIDRQEPDGHSTASHETAVSRYA